MNSAELRTTDFTFNRDSQSFEQEAVNLNLDKKNLPSSLSLVNPSTKFVANFDFDNESQGTHIFKIKSIFNAEGRPVEVAKDRFVRIW
jgi:hypothetical protein